MTKQLQSEGLQLTNKTAGPMMSLDDACEKAGISKATLYNYVNQGHLELQFDGGVVYYRDLLRASWLAKQNQMKNGVEGAYKRKAKNV
jgi:phage pi2 protein 07